MAHVSEKRPAGSYPFDDPQRLLHAEVGYMRTVAKPTNYQDIQIRHQTDCSGRDLRDVRDIGTVQEAVSKDLGVTVAHRQWNKLDPRSKKRALDCSELQGRHAAAAPDLSVKEITEGVLPEIVQMLRFAIDRHRISVPTGEDSQIIHSGNVIKVVVCEDHRVEPTNSVGQSLDAEIPPTVDEDGSLRAVDQGCSVCPAISRIF
jgi:hypothetical protein